MESNKNSKRWIAKLVVIIVLFLLLMAGAALFLWPYIKQLAEPETQAAFEAWVQGLGFWGVLVMFGLQVLQIFITFIPGEPIEIISGLLYGGFGGLVICLSGCALASSAVFLLMRRFGCPLVRRTIGEDKLKDFAYLHNSKRLETVVFLLFLIPGAPKDILTYIIGIVSPMKLSTFLMLAVPARIPSVITSTFLGSNLAGGNWAAVVSIFLVTAVVGLLCIRNKDKITNTLKRLSEERRQSE